MNFFRALATVAGLTLLSRIAGFIRDILTAALLGAGPLADAFFVALKLPNFFRRISAEGAFTIAFVPVYTSIKEEQGAYAARVFAGNVFALMIAILGSFVTLSMLFMPVIIRLIAPGFDVEGESFAAAVSYARITFPYLLLISLAAMFGAVLNIYNKFAPFAAAPVLFNATLIAAMLYADMFGYEVSKALSWGVSLSGIVQLGFMAFFIGRYKIWPLIQSMGLSDDARKVFRLMGPGMLGAGVMHVNLFADMIIASFLPVGAISALYYADRLNQLPLGMVGIAMGTALLPMLSSALASKKMNEARRLFNQGLQACVFFALPAALALFVLAEFIISVLFERGAFDAESTRRASFALMAYSIGIVPYVASKVLSTVFWAHKDTWTPVKISIRVTAINIVLSIALVFPFKEAGIALSTGLVGWLQLLWLRRALQRDYPDISLSDAFYKRGLKLLLSGAVMAASVWGAAYIGQAWLSAMDANYGLAQFALLGGVVFLGASIYFALVFMLRIYNLRDMKYFFVKKSSM